MDDEKKKKKYEGCRATMALEVESGCCSRKGKIGCDGCTFDMPFKDWKKEYETREGASGDSAE